MKQNKYLNNLDATNYSKAEFKNEKIEQMVKDRNDLLIKFGQIVYDTLIPNKCSVERMKFGEYSDVKIIGNSHQPTLVFNNHKVFSLFVNNFKVYLSDQFKDGEVLTSINLNLCTQEDGEQLIVDEFEKHFKKLMCKELYRIEKGNGMFFSKFDAVGHPYYSTTNPQLFFKYEEAQDMLSTLQALSISDIEIS